jgi:hypothetical protein
MTRKMKAEHDAVNEAGLLPTHDTLCSLQLILPCILFASLASAVYAGSEPEGWLSLLRYLRVQFSDDLNVFACVGTSVRPFLFSDEVYQSP